MAGRRGAIWVLAAIVATTFADSGAARAVAAIPDFSPSPKVGWVAYGPEFIPIPGQPHPVAGDPAHPWVPNAVEYFFGRPRNLGNQTTSPMADLSNPILRPVTRAALARLKADILAGKTIDNRTAGCWPMGVPASLVQPVRANYFLQGLHEVLITSQGTQDVRHIHLNAAHAANLKPSWFGDSVGHYEGDTLVVDTIGVTTKAFVDNFRTPHSPKLHVVERYRLFDGGRTLQVRVHVEDPDAFTTPWNALQRFARVERGPLVETAVQLLQTAPKPAAAPDKLPRLGGLGFTYLYAGAPERALEYFEVQAQAGDLIPIRFSEVWHPSYAAVRKTERFKKFVRDAGLVDYWKVKGWPPQCHPTTGDDFECN